MWRIWVYCCVLLGVGCLVRWDVSAVELPGEVEGRGGDMNGMAISTGAPGVGERGVARAMKAINGDERAGYGSESGVHLGRKLSEAKDKEGMKDNTKRGKQNGKGSKGEKKKQATEKKKMMALEAARVVAVRFGFIATIRRADSHMCVGALVDYSTVVTVASCVDPRLSSTSLPNPTVWVGALKNDEEDGGMEVRKAKKIKLHPKWTGLIRNGYDIAALQLDKPIVKHTPIRITNPSVEEFILGKIEMLRLIGYGRTSPNSALPPYARIGALKPIPTDTCNDKYYDGVVSKEMMCAGETMSEACPGDEGAPLFAEGANEKRDYLFGLASVVNANCGFSSERPGVFTRISAVADFIEEAITEFI